MTQGEAGLAWRLNENSALAYVAAAVIAGLSVLLRWALDPYLAGIPFITSVPAVVLAAYLCGRGPGVLVALSCGLADGYLFIAPVHSFRIAGPAEAIALSLYFATALAVAVLLGGARLALRRERKAAVALRDSEARLAFLDQLGIETAALADADAVLATTTRLLGEHLNLSVCAYADMDADADGFTIRGDWAAPGSKSIVGHYRLADFGRLAVKNLGAGLPLVVNDNRVELAPEEAATFQNIGIAATICMPLVKQGRLTALMAIHDRAPRVWTDAELGLLREVTARSWAHVERVGAAAELRASEERLRAVFEQASAGFARTDLTGRFTEVNDRYCTIVGRSRDELLTLRMQDITHPDDLAANLPLFAAAASGGPPFEIEKRYLKPDGSTVWVRNSVSAVRSADGEVAGTLAVSIDLTQKRLAEARLRESEAQLRRGLAAARMVVWTHDLADGTVTRSENADEIFGPGSDAAAFNARMPEEDAAANQARLAAAISGAAPSYESEFRYRHPDGRLLWLLNQGQVVRDSEGNPVRVHGVCLDVTARKAAELALRNLNETLEQRVAAALDERRLLADLVEGTDAFVQVADSDFRWLAINKAAADEFEQIYGVRPKAGDSMLDLLAHQPEHRAAVRAVWARALAGEAFTEVGAFGDPVRGRRFHEMKYNVLRDADGQQIGAFQFVYDVTERVDEQRRLAEVEAARRETDALYRAYFENTPEALFVIGVEPDGGFVVEEVNPAHEAGIGLKLDDIRGRRVADVLPEAAARRILETYRHVVETGAIYQYREEYDLTGSPQHWDTSLVPIRDEAGRIVRLIGSSRNVTRQVLAEDALRQAQKMESMGQLTGGVAHDFNNLLSPIVGSLDMLQRRGVGGERERRLIDSALQSAERARTLVQRLLAFARRQPLQAQAVDVGALVEGMGDLVASTSGPRVKVEIDVEAELPPARADLNQVEMAILNLAVNARDAMPDGGRLTITATAETAGRDHGAGLVPGRYVRLSVADTGVGMDEATRLRAVEPFFSTKGIGRGTGLGLSMVHGLAAQLGGALHILSRPGLGTNVELWLPVSDAAAPAPDAAVSGGEPAATGTVLLVDDEELVRMSTAEMLVELGYAVIEAGSAEAALRLVADGLRFDLLVTDHLMAGMTGTELARELRARRPGMPVLVVSGYADVEGLPPDLPALAKPFRRDDLAASLASLALGA